MALVDTFPEVYAVPSEPTSSDPEVKVTDFEILS